MQGSVCKDPDIVLRNEGLLDQKAEATWGSWNVSDSRKCLEEQGMCRGAGLSKRFSRGCVEEHADKQGL